MIKEISMGFMGIVCCIMIVGIGWIVLQAQIEPGRLCDAQNWTGNITTLTGINYDCVELEKINVSLMA